MFIFVSTSHRKGDQPVGMNKKSRVKLIKKQFCVTSGHMEEMRLPANMLNFNILENEHHKLKKITDQ